MGLTPHPDTVLIPLNCAVITVSDTRTSDTDRSGQLIQQLLAVAEHQVTAYFIIQDEPAQIEHHLYLLGKRSDVDVIILNGGTGIAPRDTTYDVVERLLEKPIPGFGEIFRWLSYAEIGSRAIASRAIAGVFQETVIFSLPGSSNAVLLAMQKLIVPEMRHLVSQLRTGNDKNLPS
ncbi:MAG: molybdenum cofactor biosynthesis protein [Leptolyngbya sp.]|nr:MAG: molybdenum cofactor biosynthesis protein [Leptolyngbya sp.]